MRTWQEFMKDRIEGREAGVPFYLHDKLKCHYFCKENNIPTSEILKIFDKPEDIELKGLPVEFVLKPTLQSSMKGVMVLRTTGGGYFDSLRQRDLTLEEITDEQGEMYNLTRAVGKKIIVEKIIKDVNENIIPRDFKAYAFRGKIALILEINRNSNPASVSWFDGDFEPIDDSRVVSNPKYVNPVKAVMPMMAVGLLALARSVSAAIPTPFASIDMYATTNGPILGEVTLAPGGLYYGQHFVLSDDQQALMGRMWLRAVEEMAASNGSIRRDVLAPVERMIDPLEAESLLTSIHELLDAKTFLTIDDYRRALIEIRSNT